MNKEELDKQICQLENTQPGEKITADQANDLVTALGGKRQFVGHEDDIATGCYYIVLLSLRRMAKEEAKGISSTPISMFPVENSSNVEACGWINNTLAVEFKGGAIYHYFYVPTQVFDELMAADSFGKYLNGEIKPRFRCEKQ